MAPTRGPGGAYSTCCECSFTDWRSAHYRTKVNFQKGSRKRESTKIIISKGIAHHFVRLLKTVNSPKYSLAPTLKKSRFRGITNLYGQRAVYEILATLATKIWKMKVGRVKVFDFDRQKLVRTSQKMFGSSHFESFSIFRAQFVNPRLKMAHSKPLKLVSSCSKIGFKAKLSKQKILRILPQIS
jgi:hypothetical protein